MIKMLKKFKKKLLKPESKKHIKLVQLQEGKIKIDLLNETHILKKNDFHLLLGKFDYKQLISIKESLLLNYNSNPFINSILCLINYQIHREYSNYYNVKIKSEFIDLEEYRMFTEKKVIEIRGDILRISKLEELEKKKLFKKTNYSQNLKWKMENHGVIINQFNIEGNLSGREYKQLHFFTPNDWIIEVERKVLPKEKPDDYVFKILLWLEKVKKDKISKGLELLKPRQFFRFYPLSEYTKRIYKLRNSIYEKKESYDRQIQIKDLKETNTVNTEKLRRGLLFLKAKSIIEIDNVDRFIFSFCKNHELNFEEELQSPAIIIDSKNHIRDFRNVMIYFYINQYMKIKSIKNLHQLINLLVHFKKGAIAKSTWRTALTEAGPSNGKFSFSDDISYNKEFNEIMN